MRGKVVFYVVGGVCVINLVCDGVYKVFLDV